MSDYNLKDYLTSGSGTTIINVPISGNAYREIIGSEPKITSTYGETAAYGAAGGSYGDRKYITIDGEITSLSPTSGNLIYTEGSGSGTFEVSYKFDVDNRTTFVTIFMLVRATSGYMRCKTPTITINYNKNIYKDYPYIPARIDLGNFKVFESIEFESLTPSNCRGIFETSDDGRYVQPKIYCDSLISTAVSCNAKITARYTKFAKIKFNGVVYNHIKFNGKVII